MHPVKTHIRYDAKLGGFKVWFTSGAGYFELVGIAKTLTEANHIADVRYTEVMNARAEKEA